MANAPNIVPNTRKGQRCWARISSIVLGLKSAWSGSTASIASRRTLVARDGSERVRASTNAARAMVGFSACGTYATASGSVSWLLLRWRTLGATPMTVSQFACATPGASCVRRICRSIGSWSAK